MITEEELQWAPYGSRLIIGAHGPDAGEALEKLAGLIAKGFNEK